MTGKSVHHIIISLDHGKNMTMVYMIIFIFENCDHIIIRNDKQFLIRISKNEDLRDGANGIGAPPESRSY